MMNFASIINMMANTSALVVIDLCHKYISVLSAIFSKYFSSSIYAMNTFYWYSMSIVLCAKLFNINSLSRRNLIWLCKWLRRETIVQRWERLPGNRKIWVRFSVSIKYPLLDSYNRTYISFLFCYANRVGIMFLRS